jgi:hypothetical protein
MDEYPLTNRLIFIAGVIAAIIAAFSIIANALAAQITAMLAILALYVLICEVFWKSKIMHQDSGFLAEHSKYRLE